jgi:arabinose-5-phosphate isomerase
MRDEGLAILEAADWLRGSMNRAAELILGMVGDTMDIHGKVVTTGVGKSGMVARKLAATLNATGQPAVYLHPVDALHGDLGIVADNDVVILVSRSGATLELIELLDHLGGLWSTIGIIGTPDSPLAGRVECCLDASAGNKANHLGLVPTASAAVAMAIGDGLACALMQARGITREDLVRLHPAGSSIPPPQHPNHTGEGVRKCAVTHCNEVGQLRFCGIWICAKHGLEIVIHAADAIGSGT